MGQVSPFRKAIGREDGADFPGLFRHNTLGTRATLELKTSPIPQVNLGNHVITVMTFSFRPSIRERINEIF